MLRHSLFAGLAVLLSQGLLHAQSAREWNPVSVQPSAAQPTAAGSPDLQEVQKLILAGVNRFRSQEGKGALRTDPKLAKTAEEYANYLARTDKFSHTADGKEPWERAQEHGYHYCIVLENIAYEFNSEGFTAQALADAFIDGWKHSPGHRRNMLDGDVTETGIGVARSSRTGSFYAVQDFGRPRSAAIEFRVINHTDQAVQFRLGKHLESIRPGFTWTFTRCRPTEVDFHLHGKRQAFHPQNGGRLVLEPAQGGGYQVRTEK